MKPAKTQHVRTGAHTIEEQRQQTRQTGVAAFIENASGLEFAKRNIHRLQDRSRARAYLSERAALRERLQLDAQSLEQEYKRDRREMGRQFTAMWHLEHHELEAFKREHDAKTQAQGRGDDSGTPLVARGVAASPAQVPVIPLAAPDRCPACGEDVGVLAAFRQSEKERLIDERARSGTSNTPNAPASLTEQPRHEPERTR